MWHVVDRGRSHYPVIIVSISIIHNLDEIEQSIGKSYSVRLGLVYLDQDYTSAFDALNKTYGEIIFLE